MRSLFCTGQRLNGKALSIRAFFVGRKLTRAGRFAWQQAEGPDASPCGELAGGPSGGGHNSRPPQVRSNGSLCPCHLDKGVAVPHTSCSGQAPLRSNLWTDTDGSRVRCHLRLSFAALPAVSLISVPSNESFPARIAVWRPSVPPNACFPAPPPTGCHGRRLRHAAAVGSVQWPTSRRPLPRDVQDTGTGIPAVDAANP